jgi:hypothetical protein
MSALGRAPATSPPHPTRGYDADAMAIADLPTCGHASALSQGRSSPLLADVCAGGRPWLPNASRPAEAARPPRCVSPADTPKRLARRVARGPSVPASRAAVEVCEREIKCLITGRATIERMLRDDPEALGPRGRAAPAPADHHVAQDVELAADHLAPGYDGVEAMAGPEARPGLPIAPEPLRPPLPEAGAVALQEFVGALGSSPAGPAIYFTGIIRCS